MGKEKAKPVVKYDPNGETGNIYVIIGMARKALQIANRDNEGAELTKRVVNATSYENALSIIGEYVTLMPKSN